VTTVLDLFAAQVVQTPDAEAVVLGQQRLTYRELDERTDRLGRFLRDQGARAETVVGLCLERSIDMIVGLLAILKAGGAYLPLEPDLPPARLELMLKSAAPVLVLTQRSLAGRLPAGVAVVYVDDERAATDARPDVLDARIRPAHLAYVVFTSGSTGVPKGIMVDHRALHERAAAKTEIYGFGPGDRILQFTSLAFDAAGAEIYPALLAGATLVIHPSPKWTSPQELLNDCRAFGISGVMLPPVFLQLLVDTLAASGERIDWLKYFITGGESIPVSRLAAFARLNPHKPRFVYAYGPTETTIAATVYLPPMDPELIERLGKVPIGRPLPGTGAHILDDVLRPVPDGEVGELWITGSGLARGYIGDPALTAERFVACPFGPAPGARMYRTGDLARISADGELEFAGRVDNQVKIRGFRVDPGDVEAALALHPGLGPSIVVAREGRLAAYCVPRAGVRTTSREVRAFLSERLPEYMVPPSFILVDALPLLPGGKVDLSSLPAPVAVAGPEPAAAFATRAASPVERLLAEIWCDLLHREQIVLDEDFFEAGGDSLLANQVVARVREALGVDVPLRSVFRSPTIAGLALAITECLVGDDAPDAISELLASLEGMPEEAAARQLQDEEPHG
jgi:amino acid adenylation domain-containing protein